jgi:hypothetical protein
MSRRITIIICLTIVAYYTTKWAIINDTRWETVISAMASIATLISFAAPLVKIPLKNRDTGAAFNTGLIHGTNGNEDTVEENKDLEDTSIPVIADFLKKQTAKELRIKLFATVTDFDLVALKNETLKTMETDPDPDLVLVLREIEKALQYTEKRFFTINSEHNIVGKGMSEYYSDSPSYSFREAKRSGKSINWFVIIISLTLLTGLLYVIYRIGEYWITHL